MIKLFCLYAILIFAKRAPKMITDLLNVKGEGVGLKGLNIKNKLGDAALVGDKVKKGMLAAEGSAKKTAGGALSGFVSTKGGITKRLKGAGKGAASGIISGGREAIAKGDTKGMFTGSIKDVGDYARGGEPSIWSKMTSPIKKGTDWIESKGYNSLEQARMKEADGYKERLKNMYGSAVATQLLGNLKVNFSDADSYNNYKKDLKALTEVSTPKSKVPLSNGNVFDASAASSLYVRQNLLKERNKTLQAIQELSDQYIQAQQAGDSRLAAAIQTNMEKKFKEGHESGLFSDYSLDLGVDGLKLNNDNYRKALELSDDYKKALSNGDSARAAVIYKDLANSFELAKNDGYFKEEDGSSLDIENGLNLADADINADINLLRADLKNTIIKTGKAEAAATKDVENSEKKPTPSSSGDNK